MIRLLLILYLLQAPVYCSESRVYAHMLIHDYKSACEEAKQVVRKYPESQTALEAYIQALAKYGDVKNMLAAWKQFVSKYPEKRNDRQLLECMAWGIIEKGAGSSSPIVRAVATLAAFLGNDAKGVSIVQTRLRDHNTFVRNVAVQVASDFRDAKLQAEILRLLRNEKNWEVRLGAIRAVGKMDIKQAKPELMSIIADGRARADEKAAAIQSLVAMLETADRKEVMALAKSDRAGLRQLACQVVAYCDLNRDLDLITPLLRDYHPEVRASATLACGMFRTEHVKEMIRDPDPYVAMTAAWGSTIIDPNFGQKAFETLIDHPSRDIRLKAAAALVATGKYGASLIEKYFHQTKDPYIKMNLALGLINQRKETEHACYALFTGLLKEKERWMWDEDGFFRLLMPSKVNYRTVIPNYPEVVNQLTRLEILNVLAVMQDTNAQNAIRQFLKERSWGITGVASAMLLIEGDDAAIELVQGLLRDPNQKIRVQAALVLSLWGQDERAIATLEQAYDDADRNLKESILEGIGRVGADRSLPFLVDKLNESYPTLRLIAASSLLQCLYH